jgi:sugar phosphate isomerase/epimerase
MRYSVQTAVLPELSCQQVVEKLSRHGYDAVEWRIHEDYHVSPARVLECAPELKRLCADHGLAISCLTGYAPLEDLDQQRRMVEACALMACPRYRPGAVIYDGSRPYDALYQQTVERLGRIIEVTSPLGVKPIIETHFSTIAPSASLAHRLVQHFDATKIGVNYDPANLIIEGREAWQMGLELLGPYLDYVHAKNIAWNRVDGRWRWVFDAMQSGQVDWREVMTALRSVGYDGYVSFENFYKVPMRSTGFVGEDLTQIESEYRDIDERLREDLAFIKKCVSRMIQEPVVPAKAGT